MRPKVASRLPPAHLHAAAKLAWTDIVGLQGRSSQGSDADLERAAVLLATGRAWPSRLFFFFSPLLRKCSKTASRAPATWQLS